MIGVRADILQTATVRVWNNDKCQKSYREQEKPHKIATTQMCAGNNGVDSCWVIDNFFLCNMAMSMTKTGRNVSNCC